MRQHWWEYSRTTNSGKNLCLIEVVVYANRQSMVRGIKRHRAKLGSRGINDKNFSSLTDCTAMCRSWDETHIQSGKRVPINRLFFSLENINAGVIAHEGFHAAMHIERFLTNNIKTKIRMTDYGGPKTVSEEGIARLTETIVHDVLNWAEQDYPDEIPS